MRSRLLLGLASLAVTFPTYGTPVALYDADAGVTAPDPTTPVGGDWTNTVWGTGTSATAVSDGGLNAWQVADTSHQTGSTLRYFHAVSSGEIALLAVAGWSLEAELRMVDGGTASQAVCIQYAIGDSRWFLAFDLGSTSGNLTYHGAGGSGTLIGDGSGAETYHTFTIRNDSGSGNADFFFDNTLVTTVVADSISTPKYGADFGVASSAGDGTANFRRVELWALPEPGTLSFLALVGLMVMRRRRF